MKRDKHIKRNSINKDKKSYNPDVDGYLVNVLAITDTGTIITSGGDGFEYGIIFQHGIQYDSKPLPIDLSSTFAKPNIPIGKRIRMYVSEIKNISGVIVAISTIEIAGKNQEDEDAFNDMRVGDLFHLTVFDYNDEYVTLRVPGTSLRGYIDAKAIPNPEIGQEYDLRLSKKGHSVFQLLRFE